MARDRAPREGIYVEKPRNDVYVALLAVSFFAMVGACVIMKFFAIN